MIRRQIHPPCKVVTEEQALGSVDSPGNCGRPIPTKSLFKPPWAITENAGEGWPGKASPPFPIARGLVAGICVRERGVWCRRYKVIVSAGTYRYIRKGFSLLFSCCAAVERKKKIKFKGEKSFPSAPNLESLSIIIFHTWSEVYLL